LLYKNFLLLCFGVAAVQMSSVLVAYAMPSNQKMRYVHYSRISSVIVVLFTVIIPFEIASVKTDCLANYEDNHRRLDPSTWAAYSSSYSSSYSSGDDAGHLHDDVPGLTIVEALILTALIVVVSFVISFFSIDVDREHTYKELEEAAHAQHHGGHGGEGHGGHALDTKTNSVFSDDGSRDEVTIKSNRNLYSIIHSYIRVSSLSLLTLCLDFFFSFSLCLISPLTLVSPNGTLLRICSLIFVFLILSTKHII
jgi:hypothetical protein